MVFDQDAIISFLLSCYFSVRGRGSYISGTLIERKKKHSASIFVGAEREDNLIRNDPDKSEFNI